MIVVVVVVFFFYHCDGEGGIKGGERKMKGVTNYLGECRELGRFLVARGNDGVVVVDDTRFGDVARWCFCHCIRAAGSSNKNSLLLERALSVSMMHTVH